MWTRRSTVLDVIVAITSIVGSLMHAAASRTRLTSSSNRPTRTRMISASAGGRAAVAAGVGLLRSERASSKA
jgi:hypothetical protein